MSGGNDPLLLVGLWKQISLGLEDFHLEKIQVLCGKTIRATGFSEVGGPPGGVEGISFLSFSLK